MKPRFGTTGTTVRAIAAGIAICWSASLAAQSPSPEKKPTSAPPPAPPAAARPEMTPAERLPFDESVQRIIDANRPSAPQSLPGMDDQNPNPPAQSRPQTGPQSGPQTDQQSGPQSGQAAERDPTRASPKMQEILGARTATSPQASARPQPPRIDLKGRVIGPRSASVALLSVDGGPPIQVREGASFSYLQMTLRVTKLDVQEVQILVEPLDETIVVR